MKATIAAMLVLAATEAHAQLGPGAFWRVAMSRAGRPPPTSPTAVRRRMCSSARLGVPPPVVALQRADPMGVIDATAQEIAVSARSNILRLAILGLLVTRAPRSVRVVCG
jgi:hypothetical protein